jgi:cytochrome c-type biogenesis protein CcmF
MIIELGHYALVLALGVSVLQAIMPVFGALRGDRALMEIGTVAAKATFLLVALSFGVLTYAHVTSDFSVQNVWENSHSQVPLLYKYSGVWGNHEGSMLLWVLILTFFSALVAVFGDNLP